MPKLNERELGTILAALRYWRRQTGVRAYLAHDNPELWGVSTGEGRFAELGVHEIDALCERLNIEMED